jgi:alpha-glucuronidase
MRLPLGRMLGLSLCAVLVAAPVRGESGHDAWLRYAPLDAAAARQVQASIPGTLVAVEDQTSVLRARDELVRGFHGMVQKDVTVSANVPAQGAIVIGTLAALQRVAPALAPAGTLAPDAFWIRSVSHAGARYLVVAGESGRAVLYGAFALLRQVASGRSLNSVDRTEAPYAPQRWINQWDNIDGTIERGYGGRSIFWNEGHVREDLSRVSDYGRLLASIGINGISINNVNANRLFLSPELVPQVARVADALRPWGVRVALAVDFGSPSTLGGLPTYDPLDPAVAAWWRARTDALYAAIPDFAGFVLKADSEGRVGPSTYGRTHADAANVVARALKPHGGVIFYRGFVYDHHMDWTNPKNDRARAAYDNFQPLDGAFDDNAIVQIKHGPIDFQVREPASPLFGALARTNQGIELQITQEYFGQARDTVFLVPMWKSALDFDLKVRGDGTPIKALAAGKTFNRPLGGFVGVANVGSSENWLGNHLSQANLYGFGRLAWDPDLSAETIADEWTRATFGNDPRVVRTVTAIQLGSWRTFENYTGPLGLQTLTDIVGNHYGVAVEASERNGWGQWHRADDQGVGMDRTVATGTGYIGQYSPPVRAVFESVESCPDDLLLFMHHVPYTHRLHGGKTVIQSIYDSHYDGAEAVARYARDWRLLDRLIDPDRYAAVLKQLDYQAGHAVLWRDAVSRWFQRTSGIADTAGRVEHYPGRVEAESMTLAGYVVKDVTPWETASGDRAVQCPAASCSASFAYAGPTARRDIVVRYFDVMTGAARFRLRVGSRIVAEWTADDRFPTTKLDGSSSTRYVAKDIDLNTGEQIAVEGVPDGAETAAVDYMEVSEPTQPH